MKVVIDTSVLISASIFWRKRLDTGIYEVSEKSNPVCCALFDLLKRLNAHSLELCLITKSAEDESRNALYRAVGNAIHNTPLPSLEVRFKIMSLQDIIWNDCLDNMELILEETSTRPPLSRDDRDWITQRELKPFFRKVVATTVRYVQPSIPPVVKDLSLRNELTDIMIKTTPAHGVIYKGFPEPRDLAIMAEATMIFRRYRRKERVYIASRDNHFKPNPVQVGSYLTGRLKYSGQMDSTIRDDAAKRFGFIGEHPAEIIKVLNATYAKELSTPP